MAKESFGNFQWMSPPKCIHLNVWVFFAWLDKTDLFVRWVTVVCSVYLNTQDCFASVEAPPEKVEFGFRTNFLFGRNEEMKNVSLVVPKKAEVPFRWITTFFCKQAKTSTMSLVTLKIRNNAS